MSKNDKSKEMQLCGAVLLKENHYLVYSCTRCEDIFDTGKALQNHLIKHFQTVKSKTYKKDYARNYSVTDTSLVSKELDNNAVQIERDLNQMESVLDDDILTECYIEESLEANPIMLDVDNEYKVEIEIDDAEDELRKEYSSLESSETQIILEAKQEINSSEKSILLKNKRTVDKNEESKDFKHKLFISQIEMVPHRKYRRIYDGAVRKHKCQYCGFAFKDSSNLANHVRRHSGVKEYACSFCSKEFYTRTELNAHERHHTGEQPYLCPTCGETFYTSAGLSTHTKRKHEKTRNYICDDCGKGFFSNCYLQTHKISHRDERSVHCPQCPTRFKTRKSLQRHMKIHLNKREYLCHVCDASFNQRSGLTSHLKSKHGILPKPSEK